MTTFPFTRFDYTGATTYSPIGFEYEDPSQVQVIIADQMGRPQTLTYNLDYTVDRSDDSITLSPDRHWDVEPEKVFVMRNTATSDSPVFPQGVYLDVRKVQQALETMRLQISEVKMSADNSIKLSAQDWHREGADNPVTIPPADKRAGRILAFDDDGNVLMVLTTDIEQKLQDALQAETNSVAIKESVDESKAEVMVALAESLSTVNRAKAEADKAYEHSIQASIHEAGALRSKEACDDAIASFDELRKEFDEKLQEQVEPDDYGEVKAQVQANENSIIGLSTTKADASDLTFHTTDTVIHITQAEREQWNNAKPEPEGYQTLVGNVTQNTTDISSLTDRVQTLEDEPSIPADLEERVSANETRSLSNETKLSVTDEDIDNLFTGETGDGSTLVSDVAVLQSQVALNTGSLASLVDSSSIVAYGGSDSTGYYIRYSNGVQMCWKRQYKSELTFSTWGSLYTSQVIDLGAMPMPFVAPPVATYTSNASTTNWTFFVCIDTPTTSTSWSNVVVARGTSINNTSAYCNAFAIGRWK